MSALNFFLDKNVVLITSDTLIIDADDKTPYKFQSNVIHLPQLNCAICGVGNPALFADWINYLQKNVVAYGIDAVHEITRNILPELAQMKAAYQEAPLELYQFGLSESDDVFVGYRYAPGNDYQGTVLENGIGLLPALAEEDNPGIDFSDTQHIDASLITLMQKQKTIDDALDLNDPNKFGIGGQIQFLQMTKALTLAKTLHTFDDYLDQKTYIEETIKHQNHTVTNQAN